MNFHRIPRNVRVSTSAHKQMVFTGTSIPTLPSSFQALLFLARVSVSSPFTVSDCPLNCFWFGNHDEFRWKAAKTHVAGLAGVGDRNVAKARVAVATI